MHIQTINLAFQGEGKTAPQWQRCQLDPIAASEFLRTVQKINRDLGTTVIISEHRLEEVFTMANKVMVMDKGKVLAYDEPRKIGSMLAGTGEHDRNPMFYGLPAVMKIYQSGDLSQLGKDANDNGAGLTAEELAELNKTIVSLEFTKTGKLFFIYKENGKEITESATWNSSDFLNFIVDEISEANKFIDKNSKIQVAYSANGACTISFFTKITGSKTYDAQLTVNLE